MSVITNNTIQPSSGQALTIKDEGGTASITVATNGEATFAENIILTANKGLSFQNHSVSSVTGASSTTSANVLDDYEEGTWTPTNSAGVSITVNNAYYQKIGNTVFVNAFINIGTNSSSSGTIFGGLPYSMGTGTNSSVGCFGDESIDLYVYANNDLIHIRNNANSTRAFSQLSNNFVAFQFYYKI